MTGLKSKAKRRVIWAIDPFEEKGEARSHVVATLKELAAQGASIEPVYVLSPDEYEIDIEFNAPWLKQLWPTAKKVLDHYLRDVPVEGLLEAQVIVEKRPSLTQAVRALLFYAKQVHADTILVGTHAKKGISRFFLGSFAETLVLHSKIPVLVVGPRSGVSHRGSKLERMLFPTDFAASSYPAFKRALALAKARGSRITLLHCLPHPIEPFFQSSAFLLGGGYVSFPDFLTRSEQRKKKMAARYVNLAKKQGIEVNVEFNLGRGSTAQAVVDQARKEGSDLIVMAAESGAVSAALAGSITRQVVRSAPCPIWVLRVAG